MRKILILSSFLLFAAAVVVAQKSAVFVADGAAIHGYDAVAYFNEGRPVKGDSLLSYSWNGATWQFANRNNLLSFQANPEKFVPQYGGYCAFGMASGHKAPTDPAAWKIVDGKLYLNYNKDVQQLWFKKQADIIATADKNWPALKDR